MAETLAQLKGRGDTSSGDLRSLHSCFAVYNGEFLHIFAYVAFMLQSEAGVSSPRCSLGRFIRTYSNCNANDDIKMRIMVMHPDQ